MKHQKGLILIELIMTIVLIGIIATFTGFFIYSGINGYLRAKYITNGSLDAQRALDRITYKSAALTGTRTLKFVGDTIIINVDPNDYILLENVSTFNLSYAYLNLDDDPAPVL